MDTRAYYQQLDVFNHIDFDSVNHAYKIAGKRAKSVTETLKTLVKAFDGVYWAEKKAFELNISADELLKKWEINAKTSKVKGTLVHTYLESIFTASKFDYPEEFILNEFGFDPIQDAFNAILPQVDKFILDIQGKMYSIATEFRIGDLESLVCGTVDQIFYNQKSKALEIWDWKTNKEIKTFSRYYHLEPIAHIPDTELDHYSLQLSIYKEILERNTGVKFGNSYLTWFNENNKEYQIFRTHNYTKEAQLILSMAV
jgi:hypothetical protein